MSIFLSPLEPILAEISDQRKPPRHRSLTLAAKQNTLYDFRFTRAPEIFFIKEKSILLGSALNEQAAGLAFIFVRARRNSPHTPFRRVLAFD
ncbi:MAG TPA: hypothetical protein VNK70_00610 [Candidatus Paceibacterota bacterium]|nr:hypothetical protein [Candidatus Paceibacterota bacterium]